MNFNTIFLMFSEFCFFKFWLGLINIIKHEAFRLQKKKEQCLSVLSTIGKNKNRLLTSRNKSKYIKCKTTLNSISIELNFLLIFYFVYSKSIMDLNYQNCFSSVLCYIL